MRLPVQETQETQGHDWVTERAHKHLQHCHTINILSVSSAAQSCLTLCDPMDYNTPGLPVHHQLLEFTQSHVHWVGDAIQPSHPLSSPSPPAFNLPSFMVSSNVSILCIRFQLQHQPSQWIFHPLGWTG